MYVAQGKILESGNHEELMAKKGYYYKLYMAQYDTQPQEVKESVI